MAKPATAEHQLRTLADLKADPENPREISPEALLGLQESLHTFGDLSGIVWNKRTGQLVCGHQRLDALRLQFGDSLSLDLGQGPAATAVLRTKDGKGFPIRVVDWEIRLQRLANLAANNPHIAGAFTRELQPQIHALLAGEEELLRSLRLELLLEQEAAAIEPKPVKLAERFVIPPFSIFDTRQGYWQDRRRQWLSLGIKSEIGRGSNLLKMSDTILEPDPVKRAAKVKYSPNEHLDEKAQKALGFYASYDNAGALERGTGGYTGTSIFDPVLAEIVYRWFCPEAGAVLDPFAGGSVRGIVAGMCGRSYTGIDLRPDQVEANNVQAREIMRPGARAEAAAKPVSEEERRPIFDPDEITPIEKVGPYFLKRDCLFELGAANGCKARTMTILLKGAKGVVGFGSRKSTMISRVAQVAAHVKLPCRIHTATGDDLTEMIEAREAGAELIQHSPGYLSVLKARAEKDAEALGWVLVPWGMECPEAIAQGRKQAANIPTDTKRLVIPVGSGIAISGVLWGLKDRGLLGKFPILGVRIHSDPTERLDKWAPENWRKVVEMVQAKVPFEKEVPNDLEGVKLDPIYEAKCIPFLLPGDLFWVVGIRRSAKARPAPKVEQAPAAEAGPEWARGYSVPDLKTLAALYKESNKEFALGAFSQVKENQLAEWAEAGSLRVQSVAGKPVAALVVKPMIGKHPILNFAGKPVLELQRGQAQIRSLACAPGSEAVLAQLLREAINPAGGVAEIWQESPIYRGIAKAVGLAWQGSKIKASSEIVGLWAPGKPSRAAKDANDSKTLVRLSLPSLKAKASALAARLDKLAPKFADHYSNYNKGKSWSALSLQGYGGLPDFIIKPSEMSKKWKEDNPEKLGWEIKDTPLRAQLKEAEPLIALIPGKKHRIRIMRLEKGKGELTRHADITDPDCGTDPGQLLRIHIPLATNPKVEFEMWNEDGAKVAEHMAVGEAWYLDTRKPHTAANRGPTARLHLVMDVESCPELLALLNAQGAGEITPPANVKALDNLPGEPWLPAKANGTAEPGFLPHEPRATPSRPVIPPQWVTGDSANLSKLIPPEQQADLVFSCPPYFDLEQYSDNPSDLSNLAWADFLRVYRSIIGQAVARLKPNRFACFVVGDVRDEKGFYRNFVDATKTAFLDAGCVFYNEIVLVNTAGTLPLRIGKQFQNYRKVGKMHQNVMVFFKGDPKRIKAEFGEVEVAEVDAAEAEEQA